MKETELKPKQKYKRCIDCPKYRACVREADLRKKRSHCSLADRTKKKGADNEQREAD